jgi:transcriptional regulator with XRE-family HTH domain
MVTHAKTMPLAILGMNAGFRTQTARAAALGISRNHLMILERGERFPSKRLLQKMLEVYGVKPKTLRDAIVESRVENMVQGLSDVVRDVLEKFGLRPA